MKRATRGAVTVHVGASPERVYAFVADVTRMGEWSPETYRCRWITSGVPIPGARFKGYNRRGRARWSNTLEVLSAEPGREFSFRRDVLPCGVCDWRYCMEPDGAGTLLTESYEVVKPDWRITNWFNGLMLGVADRDEDLAAGMRTTLARIREAAEAEAQSAPLRSRHNRHPGGRAMTAVNWVDRWAGEEGRHWRAEAARYDEINRAFGEDLIEAARLVPGERVLDVGCGAGAVALEAARRVRPGGSVLGVDVSPDLMAVARERLARAGAAEVELVEADAGLHRFGDGGFDVVVSRNGVMFFGDPDGAFANLARALRPGGRIAFTAPQGLERNPWIMVAGAAAAPHVGLPSGIAPGQPGPLGLADPTRIEAVLGRAGFTAVAIEELTASICIGADVEDALAFIRSMPIVRDLLAAAPPLNEAAAVEAVEQALIRHAGPDGVVLHGNGAWLVTAQRERKNPSAVEVGTGAR